MAFPLQLIIYERIYVLTNFQWAGSRRIHPQWPAPNGKKHGKNAECYEFCRLRR